MDIKKLLIDEIKKKINIITNLFKNFFYNYIYNIYIFIINNK